jgi:hypothetical protein
MDASPGTAVTPGTLIVLDRNKPMEVFYMKRPLFTFTKFLVLTITISVFTACDTFLFLDENAWNSKFDQGITGVVPTSGLIGEWLFTSSSVDPYEDTSPSGNDGTLFSDQIFRGSRLGEADASFYTDGTDWIETGRNPFAGLSEFTISVWFKTDDGTTENGAILSNYNSATQSAVGGGVQINTIKETSPDEYFFELEYDNNTDGAPERIKSSAVDLTRWNHLIAVRENGSRSRILFYLNKQVIDVIDVTEDEMGTDEVSPLFIGKDRVASQGITTGAIDDLRIYNRALDTKDIDNLYHEGGYQL